MSCCPNLQRHDVVGQADEPGDDPEEDHQRAVDGEQLVVGLAARQLLSRRGQFGANHHREEAADDEEHKGRDHVLDADDLVVRVEGKVIAPGSGAVADEAASSSVYHRRITSFRSQQIRDQGVQFLLGKPELIILRHQVCGEALNDICVGLDDGFVCVVLGRLARDAGCRGCAEPIQLGAQCADSACVAQGMACVAATIVRTPAVRRPSDQGAHWPPGWPWSAGSRSTHGNPRPTVR